MLGDLLNGLCFASFLRHSHCLGLYCLPDLHLPILDCLSINGLRLRLALGGLRALGTFLVSLHGLLGLLELLFGSSFAILSCLLGSLLCLARSLPLPGLHFLSVALDGPESFLLFAPPGSFGLLFSFLFLGLLTLLLQCCQLGCLDLLGLGKLGGLGFLLLVELLLVIFCLLLSQLLTFLLLQSLLLLQLLLLLLLDSSLLALLLKLPLGSHRDGTLSFEEGGLATLHQSGPARLHHLVPLLDESLPEVVDLPPGVRGGLPRLCGSLPARVCRHTTSVGNSSPILLDQVLLLRCSLLLSLHAAKFENPLAPLLL